MSASTPIARSKSAALARVVDSIPKGYSRYLIGTIPAAKASALAVKFHRLYGIGCTPAQRITRKAHGLASCLLVMYWPESAERVDWLVLATDGVGLEAEAKSLHHVIKNRLLWLGYELVRRPARGMTAWTWRRPKEQMRALHTLLAEQLGRHHHAAVGDTLARLAHQPGFHGVREQSWRLFQLARARGYPGDLPFLAYLPKVSHGERLSLPAP